MATHRFSILGPNTVPGAADVFVEPFDVKATNDVWKLLVFIFNDTATRLGLRGAFNIPKNYVGSAKIIVVWTSTATTNNCVWDFDYRSVGGNDAESLDQSGTQESVSVTDAAPGAALRRLEAQLTLTASNIAADDTLEFELFRDGTDGNDTMAAAAIVLDVLFEYADA